jgi:hypothetical protein
MITALMTLAAVVLIVGAVALLYLKWLGRGLPSPTLPYAVPVAWLAMLGSAALWMTAYKPDFGLPIGFLVAMSLPLALIAWRTVRTFDSAAKPEKQRRERVAPEGPELSSTRKFTPTVDNILRCMGIALATGALLAVPVWFWMPVEAASRPRWAVAVFIITFVIALAVALFARRPWRVTARLISCVVVAPVTGMTVAMLAWEYMPGHPATRYAWAVFFFSVASATALVVALSAQRPWRALGLISASTVVASAVVGGPLLIGALS